METKNMTLQLSDIVRKLANKNQGFARIFNHLRKMQFYSYLSDLGLFRSILVELSNLAKLPSKEQIRHHFRTKVSRSDYEDSNKREILEDLYNPTH